MRRTIGRRILSILLIFAMCFAGLSEIQPEAQAVSNINSLLNSVELHPQKTGYAALDKLLDSIMASCAGKTTAEKVQYCYDWTVRYIDYSWAGYTKSNSGYDGFNVAYPYNDLEDGLQKAFPDDVIARTYYTIKNHKGVCYDWGAVFAVMVRYIGIDAYVHTGKFRFEESKYGYNNYGHHGWTEVCINGKNYIFDPQREYRMCNDGKGTISHTRYYGLISGDTNYDRYTPETKINAQRDAGFLSVSAHRQKLVNINTVASRSGTVAGAGRYDITSSVTLTATPQSGKDFAGWYDYSGNLLSSELAYTFTVTGPTTVYAMFSGDQFYDVNDQWYANDALRAGEMGIITGTAAYRFDGDLKMTRASVVKMLTNAENVDLSGYTSTVFQDVPAGQWYTSSIAWAYENGIVSGTSATTFKPDATVTREQFLAIVIRYLNWKNVKLTATEVNYTDADSISDWAKPQIEQAQGIGLIVGYNDGRLGAKDSLSRAQGVSIMMRTIDFLATAEPAEDPNTEIDVPDQTDEKEEEAGLVYMTDYANEPDVPMAG